MLACIFLSFPLKTNWFRPGRQLCWWKAKPADFGEAFLECEMWRLTDDGLFYSWSQVDGGEKTWRPWQEGRSREEELHTIPVWSVVFVYTAEGMWIFQHVSKTNLVHQFRFNWTMLHAVNWSLYTSQMLIFIWVIERLSEGVTSYTARRCRMEFLSCVTCSTTLCKVISWLPKLSNCVDLFLQIFLIFPLYFWAYIFKWQEKWTHAQHFAIKDKIYWKGNTLLYSKAVKATMNGEITQYQL